MRCQICGNLLEEGVCPCCGFDLSACAELYPTLMEEVPPATALWQLRLALYQRAAEGGGARSEATDPDPVTADPDPRSDGWSCSCGYRNYAHSRFCASCGKPAPEKKDSENDGDRAPAGQGGESGRTGGRNRAGARSDGWSCECGYRNYAHSRFCASCGKSRPEQFRRIAPGSQEETWSCECGARNRMRAKFCAVCGKEREPVSVYTGS